MTDLRKLLEQWGFTAHPFDAYTAEKEIKLTDYFVDPPYLGDVLGNASTAVPVIVFGARGIGKSALRIAVQNTCIVADNQSFHGRVVAITYDDFSATHSATSDWPTFEAHLDTISRKVASAFLKEIHTSLKGSIPSRENIGNRFPGLNKKTLAKVISRLIAKEEMDLQDQSCRGVYDYLIGESKSTIEKLGTVHNLWIKVRPFVFDVFNLFSAFFPTGMPKASLTSSATSTEPASALQNKGNRRSVADDFNLLMQMSPQIGVDAWYLLIDKVDEDDRVDGDPLKSAQLIEPLLKNLKILEAPNVSFKFFLWDRLRPVLTEQKIRFDKIKNLTMSWTEIELRTMINRRLMAFSANNITALDKICEPNVAAAIYNETLTHAMNSPREIVQILDSIFREHARHSTKSNSSLISRKSIDRGLDYYCKRRISDLYPPELPNQISKLPGLNFTNNDIQSAFRVGQAAASKRITGWVNKGYVIRIEDARSQKDPNKPVHQYRVSDPRLRRIVDRRLIVPSFSEEDIEESEK